MNGKKHTDLAMFAGALAMAMAPAAFGQGVAFTQSNTLQPAFAADSIRSNLGGGLFGDLLASSELPEGLGLPADIDFNPADGLLYVIAVAEEEGQDPLVGGLGSVWSIDPATGDAQKLVGGLNAPQFLDFSGDGTALFFSEQGTGAGATFQNDGRVQRLDLTTPGAPPEIVVTAPPSGTPVGVDFDPASGDLFYMVRNQGQPENNVQQIRRVEDPLTASNIPPGGDELFFEDTTGELLTAGRNLQVVGDDLFFVIRNTAFGTVPSRLNRVPLDFGGDRDQVETVIEGQFIVDFEASDGRLWYTDALGANIGELIRANIDGTDAFTLATGPGSLGSLPIGVAVVRDAVVPCDGTVDLAPPLGVVNALDLEELATRGDAGTLCDFDGSGELNFFDLLEAARIFDAAETPPGG